MIKKQKNVNHEVTILSEETKKDMKQIVKLCYKIFSPALTFDQCITLLNTIVDLQMSYSDDISDLEDVIRAVLGCIELFNCRLGNPVYEDIDF